MKNAIEFVKKFEDLLRCDSNFKNVKLTYGVLKYEPLKGNEWLYANPRKGYRTNVNGDWLKPIFEERTEKINIREHDEYVEINNGYAIVYQNITADSEYSALMDLTRAIKNGNFL